MYQTKTDEQLAVQAVPCKRVVIMYLWRYYRGTRRFKDIREDTHLNRTCPLDRIAATLLCAYCEFYGLHLGIRDVCIEEREKIRETKILPFFLTQMYLRHFS